jgi:hypothetical protein
VQSLTNHNLNKFSSNCVLGSNSVYDFLPNDNDDDDLICDVQSEQNFYETEANQLITNQMEKDTCISKGTINDKSEGGSTRILIKDISQKIVSKLNDDVVSKKNMLSLTQIKMIKPELNLKLLKIDL